MTTRLRMTPDQIPANCPPRRAARLREILSLTEETIQSMPAGPVLDGFLWRHVAASWSKVTREKYPKGRPISTDAHAAIDLLNDTVGELGGIALYWHVDGTMCEEERVGGKYLRVVIADDYSGAAMALAVSRFMLLSQWDTESDLDDDYWNEAAEELANGEYEDDDWE